MLKSVVKGAVAGAIVVFLWGFVSWMVLPWHEKTFSAFQNEEFVGWTLKENAPTKGIYIAPYCAHQKPQTEQEKAASLDQYKKARERGPVVFASISPKGETRTM